MVRLNTPFNILSPCISCDHVKEIKFDTAKAESITITPKPNLVSSLVGAAHSEADPVTLRLQGQIQSVLVGTAHCETAKADPVMPKPNLVSSLSLRNCDNQA